MINDAIQKIHIENQQDFVVVEVGGMVSRPASVFASVTSALGCLSSISLCRNLAIQGVTHSHWAEQFSNQCMFAQCNLQSCVAKLCPIPPSKQSGLCFF